MTCELQLLPGMVLSGLGAGAGGHWRVGYSVSHAQ
jgi:hypothetical protein